MAAGGAAVARVRAGPGGSVDASGAAARAAADERAEAPGLRADGRASGRAGAHAGRPGEARAAAVRRRGGRVGGLAPPAPTDAGEAGRRAPAHTRRPAASCRAPARSGCRRPRPARLRPGGGRG